MKIFAIIISLSFMFSAFGQRKRPEVRYEYKKFEKFDFEEIGVEGEAGSPGDISISPRLRKEFRNKLPERQNFNNEMKKAIDGIR
jgi:hypothetical protein